MKISDIGEFGLIAQISEKFQDVIPQGVVGIGDDCAVIPISDNRSLVVTTDMLVEGVHFLLDKISANDLGYKSLAVNLSDIAAMGAEPHSAFLSLALPPETALAWCNDFMEGMRSHGVPLLGGDTTRSLDKLNINITAIGIVENSNLKFRSGAQVGDLIYCTSTLGNSAGGLRAILENSTELYPTLLRDHLRPRPHTAEGLALGQTKGVHSMIDISDGISSDLCHILRASSVGARVDLGAIPLSDELLSTPWDARELALSGGEDYCLLFTASADARLPTGFEIYSIGEITRENPGKVIWVEGSSPQIVEYRGFSHF